MPRQNCSLALPLNLDRGSLSLNILVEIARLQSDRTTHMYHAMFIFVDSFIVLNLSTQTLE